MFGENAELLSYQESRLKTKKTLCADLVQRLKREQLKRNDVEHSIEVSGAL